MNLAATVANGGSIKGLDLLPVVLSSDVTDTMYISSMRAQAAGYSSNLAYGDLIPIEIDSCGKITLNEDSRKNIYDKDGNIITENMNMYTNTPRMSDAYYNITGTVASMLVDAGTTIMGETDPVHGEYATAFAEINEILSNNFNYRIAFLGE